MIQTSVTVGREAQRVLLFQLHLPKEGEESRKALKTIQLKEKMDSEVQSLTNRQRVQEVTQCSRLLHQQPFPDHQSSPRESAHIKPKIVSSLRKAPSSEAFLLYRSKREQRVPQTEIKSQPCKKRREERNGTRRKKLSNSDAKAKAKSSDLEANFLRSLYSETSKRCRRDWRQSSRFNFIKILNLLKIPLVLFFLLAKERDQMEWRERGWWEERVEGWDTKQHS